MKPEPDSSRPPAQRRAAADRWFAGLADLPPAYFGIVMATGIVSIATHLAGMAAISNAWFQLNVVVYAVLSALLATHIGKPYKLEVNFFALSMWLWGGMLYIWMMSLIFYRCNFFALSPGDLSPPYWINMGAMAIPTLAGSLLILNVADAPFLYSLLPFIKGFTVFYWATGSWWIPMLLLLGFWRHVYRRFALKYDPLDWGGVFPLGMFDDGIVACIPRPNARERAPS